MTQFSFHLTSSAALTAMALLVPAAAHAQESDESASAQVEANETAQSGEGKVAPQRAAWGLEAEGAPPTPVAGVWGLVARWRMSLEDPEVRINCPMLNRPRSSIVRPRVTGRVMRRPVPTAMATACRGMGTIAWNIALNILPSLSEIVSRRCCHSLTVRGSTRQFWIFIVMVTNPPSSMSPLAPPSTRSCKHAWRSDEE
jgi:hypothetical protein